MKNTLILLMALGVAAAAPAYANAELAKTKNCMGCHAIDKKVLGPGFKEVAAKYGAEKGVEARLAAKIIKGGSGAWGPMAMPPNAVTETEALTLAKWVLAQK
ncbi:MAG: c-type cytochrome [Bdellovibrionales bacterium]|nr:c-type cytochrome [Massilia sp.]